MASQEKLEKYRAVRRQMKLRKKPVNDGVVKEFSDYVAFCADAKPSDKSSILAGRVGEAIRDGFVKRHIVLKQGASEAATAETETSD